MTTESDTVAKPARGAFDDQRQFDHTAVERLPVVMVEDLARQRARSLGARLAPFLSLRPRHFKPMIPDASEPRTGLSMGESCELMAKRWGITRTAQDEIAFESHRHAAAAWNDGFFDDLVVPFAGLQRDDNVRPDSSIEKLAGLRASFDRSASGTLTAGNSTPLTDGASAVLLASENWARTRGLPIS